jgi:hypothetical protein
MLALCAIFLAQTKKVFGDALEAMRAAGVDIIPMDMGLIVDMARREMADPLFYTFEMPRELSRHACTHCPLLFPLFL